ncbi:MAG: hypothetical protein ACK4F8_01710 [Aquabacterium sp.]
MTQPITVQIQHLLRQRAELRNEAFGATLTWFVAEGLALRLGKSVVREQVLLRGDLMLHALLGGDAPYEWDAELIAKHPMSLTALAKNLREVCDVEIADGLQLELPSGGISEPICTSVGDVVPVALLGMLGTMRIPLHVKVSIDAIGSQPHADFRFRSMLGRDLDARITTWSPQMAVAEALRQIVEGGVASVYPKRIWHLYQIIQAAKYEEAQVIACIKDTFRKRHTPLPNATPLALSDEFAAHHSRKAGWEIYTRRARIHAPPLTDVITGLRSVALPWLKSAIM